MKAASTASERLAHTAINVNASIEDGVFAPRGQKKPKRDQDPGPETRAFSPNRQYDSFAVSGFPQSADVTISKHELSRKDCRDDIQKPNEPTRDVTY